MTEEICFLCLANLNEGTLKTKRRKLLGQSCKKARDVINALTVTSYQINLSSLMEENTLICHKCKGKAETHFSLKEKVQSLEKEILCTINKAISNFNTIRHGKRSNNVSLAEIDSELAPTVPKISRQEQPDLPSENIEDTEQDSSQVSVKIKWPSKERSFSINTPWRKKCIKGIARKSLRSFAASAVSTSTSSKSILKEIAHTIRKEMIDICSVKHNSSIIRDTYDGVKYFKWDRLIHELEQKVPTLMKLLLLVVCPKSNTTEGIKLVCTIVCMMLKSRVSKMSLLQRVISVLLYGNNCSKQVLNCLQPLMISLSHSGTIKLIDRISEDHDINVQFWQQELMSKLKERQGRCHTQHNLHSVCSVVAPELEEEETTNSIEYEDWLFEDDNDNDNDNGGQEDSESEDNGDLVEGVESNGLEVIQDLVEEVTKSSCVEEIDEIGDNNTETDSGDAEMMEHNDSIIEEGNDICDVWNGFKIVGDNLDKNFRRTYQRIDFQTISHHYFHMFAVKDRINLNHLSDSPKDGVIDIPMLLPSDDDHTLMKKEFGILMSRFLVKYLSQFDKDTNNVVWHMPHKYSEEMKSKSQIVPLGMVLKNENKLDEMCEIMDEIHKYVPQIEIEKNIQLPDGDYYKYKDTVLSEILLGGDQLTVARARGAIEIRDDHDNEVDKLRGLQPVVEDWHSRMTLLRVIWKRLYDKKSASDKGTLFQLKNLINRTAVPNDPQENVQATEDFLEVILVAHIITAAEKEYRDGMSIEETCTRVIDKYVHLKPSVESGQQKDLVYTYACDVLTLGLTWFNYYDAIKEGDGERVMRLWKYLLIIFKESGRRNYAKEAALLLINFHFISSERVATQIMMSRFVNTQGRPGCNLPCDLHLEHLNRRLKGIIRRMESNVKPKTLEKAARAIGVIEEICSTFIENKQSDKHLKPSYMKDYRLIKNVLVQQDVFNYIPKRRHSFSSRSQGLLQSANYENISEWVIERIIPSFI